MKRLHGSYEYLTLSIRMTLETLLGNLTVPKLLQSRCDADELVAESFLTRVDLQRAGTTCHQSKCFGFVALSGCVDYESTIKTIFKVFFQIKDMLGFAAIVSYNT